jgi:hypothetical protein
MECCETEGRFWIRFSGKSLGFGNFKIQHKRARIGRNPKTLEEAVITARRVVKFVPSPQLIAKVNGETVDDTFNDEED